MIVELKCRSIKSKSLKCLVSYKYLKIAYKSQDIR